MKTKTSLALLKFAAVAAVLFPASLLAEEITVTTESSGTAGAAVMTQETVGAPATSAVQAPPPANTFDPSAQPLAVPAQTTPEPQYNDILGSKRTWWTLSASGLYIFDTGDEINGHTGWGGVINFDVFYRLSHNSPWYVKTGADFIYYQTDADKFRAGAPVREELQSYQVHINAGGGWRWKGLDISAFVGLGGGATHSRGTTFNNGGSNTSGNFEFQLGARIAYQPVEWCSIYAGYRMMWSIPLEGGDSCSYYDYYWDDYYCRYDRCDRGCRRGDRCCCSDKDKTDYPGVIAHAFEVGVTFYF